MILFFLSITKLNISKDVITAGEKIYANFTLNDSLNLRISFNDSELIEIMDAKVKKKKNLYEYTYTLTSYLPGEKNVYLLKDTDTIGIINFKVKSLIKGDETDIVDIKNPLNVFNPYWLFLLLIIPAILILFIVLRKPKKKKIKEEVIFIPPEDEALKSLEIARELIDNDIKMFFFSLSEIFRTYIEKKFNFPAIESTTTEINYYAKRLKLKNVEEFIPILREWDIYKFTEIMPERERAIESFNKVKEFINANR
uniref:Uncharacterized protein n=1 Tax=candidate division WOR-3 bacterium TaxID=2052148 RepID=A0A7C4UHE4_UNCW3